MCQHDGVSTAHRVPCIAVAAFATSTLLAGPVPYASATSCPDVEVVFARGTKEPPGVGGIGQAFVDSMRSAVGDRSFDVYAVNYPASTDFPTAIEGVADASAHIERMATECPATRLVLGGFSQGAAVMGFVTADEVPAGIAASQVPKPMPPSVADHVAAVALFGKPSDKFMRAIDEPSVVVGPRYAGKTIDLCISNDPICSGSGEGYAHGLYAVNGMVGEAAAYAANRL